jgi:hypothetical protein
MRLIVSLLAWVGVGGLTVALAEPPAGPASNASPPATPVSAATTDKAAVDAAEKRLISQGYKPEMRNGQRVFCRREQVMGSRLGEAKHCGTVEQLKILGQESRDITEHVQRTQLNPNGH